MRAIRDSVLLLVFTGVVGAWVMACEQKARVSQTLPSPSTELSKANSNSFDVAEFQRNKALWTSKGIQNYKMLVGASGFLTNFPDEVLIEVRSDKAVSIQSLSPGKRYTKAYEPFDTVTKLFQFVEGEAAKKPDALYVQYDKSLGCPVSIGLDERRGISDDEFSLKVKKLDVLDN